MTQVHVYSSHAVLLLDINFLLSSAVQHPTISVLWWGALTYKIARNTSKLRKLKASPFVRQERESAAVAGRELRAGPDLHHRAHHLCLLPRQCGGAELRLQPARGRLHAALQTRPQLPGTHLCVCFLAGNAAAQLPDEMSHSQISLLSADLSLSQAQQRPYVTSLNSSTFLDLV